MRQRIRSHRTSAKRRLGQWGALFVITIAFWAIAGSSPALADYATCAWHRVSPPYLSVDVVPRGGDSSAILAHHDSAVQLFSGVAGTGLQDCGAATTSNTSYVAITDATSQSQGSVGPFQLDLRNGPFVPGYGDEPGSSDEIEFKVNFGPGFDELGLNASAAASRSIRLGKASQLGSPLINLNAAETDGYDADVTLSGIDKVLIQGSIVNDQLRADGLGQARALPRPFPVPVDINANGGDDTVVGGSASDMLRGDGCICMGSGADSVFGKLGADTLYGGDGNDKLYGGDGNDTLSGGGGQDSCIGGSGSDSFSGCESIQP
jgi:hypothetical protein